MQSHPLLDELVLQLKIRGLSADTVAAYKENVTYFVKYYKGKKSSELNIRDVLTYQFHLKENKRQAPSYINQQIASIKFFANHVLKKDWKFDEIPHCKEVRNLPAVLSRNEVWRLLHATSNLKHKTMLETAYATGMRPHEICRMQAVHIQSSESLIYIPKGKGSKSRHVMLSTNLLSSLRRYWKEHPTTKESWLFPCDNDPTKLMQVDTLSSVFRRCRKKARISDEASLYSLRHTFATHLLEDGVNLRTIQQLMGHASVESTVIYLHVAKLTISQTVSPLDRLVAQQAKR